MFATILGAEMAKKSEVLKRYWISFDLGLRGNYEPLYTWLDNHEAEECGENVATFCSDQSRDRIAAELSALLDDQPARVYIIRKDIGGRFILGRRRKSPPWKGYAEVESAVEDEG